MNLKNKKRMIASFYGVSPKRVKLEPEGLDEIKSAITKSDSLGLVKRRVVIISQKDGHSRSRARKRIKQRRKGRQKGQGARKGTHSARVHSKDVWMNAIRTQRAFIKELREKGLISKQVFKEMYLKAKGGFFRSRRHIKIFLEEHNMISGKNKAVISEKNPEHSSGSAQPKSSSQSRPKEVNKPRK